MSDSAYLLFLARYVSLICTQFSPSKRYVSSLLEVLPEAWGREEWRVYPFLCFVLTALATELENKTHKSFFVWHLSGFRSNNEKNCKLWLSMNLKQTFFKQILRSRKVWLKWLKNDLNSLTLSSTVLLLKTLISFEWLRNIWQNNFISPFFQMRTLCSHYVKIICSLQKNMLMYHINRTINQV